jgi:hypothetical protein
MRAEEALPLPEGACSKRFGDLFAGHPGDHKTDKGHAGQLLSRYIGLKIDCNLLENSFAPFSSIHNPVSHAIRSVL